MTQPDVLTELDGRGLIQDHTDLDALRTRLAAGPITVYCGFDPTADSLHIGHLQQILALRRFQLAGHTPLALAGGATGMVGDPGGRSEERNLLDDETVDHNVAAITVQLEQFLDFGAAPNPAEVLDNRTWTGQLRLLEFLRDVGKHVTVNQMAAKESVKARLASDQGISYTEFSYMLLQANDYWWLNQHRGCELQIGGSDQWGNITAGVDLTRRRSQRTVHALTMPLITDQHGQKLGKSTGGGDTWLDPAKTSPYRFFQFLMQVDDDIVAALLHRLTLLPIREVEAVMVDHCASPPARTAQRRLAQEVTSLVHGTEAAATAAAASTVLFGGDCRTVSAAALAVVAQEVPRVTLTASQLHEGRSLGELLTATGLTASKGEARRTISQGGAYVNGIRQTADVDLDRRALLGGQLILLRRGKQSYAAVILDGAGERVDDADHAG